jgi:hypothetical protein
LIYAKEYTPVKDLTKVIKQLYDSGIRVTICSLVEGFDFALRDNPDQPHQFIHVESVDDIADKIHLQAIADFPSSLYVSRNATHMYGEAEGNGTPSCIGEIGDGEANQTQVQILTGLPYVLPGRIGLVMLRAPVSALVINGEEHIAPAVSMHCRQAMEIGMNLIYISKIAEMQFNQMRQG